MANRYVSSVINMDIWHLSEKLVQESILDINAIAVKMNGNQQLKEQIGGGCLAQDLDINSYSCVEDTGQNYNVILHGT